MKIIYSIAGNHKNHLYLLVLILTLSSCAIEKRRYQQGYNINWRIHSNIFAKNNHKKSRTTIVQQSNTYIKKDIENHSQPKITNEENHINNFASINNLILSDNLITLSPKSNERYTENKNLYPSYINKHLKKEIKKILRRTYAKTTIDNPDEPLEAKLATPSLIFGIFSFVCLLLLILFPGNLALALLSLFNPILALIFGSMAKAEIKDNPKLKGKGRARFGFATGLTFLILYLAILLFLLIFIAFFFTGL